MKSEIIKLGVVGVDSGQLVICDPCYISNEFIETESEYSDHAQLRERGLFIETPLDTTPHIPLGEFSYRGIGKVTSDRTKQGGQLNYKLGHEGVAVAFCSGFGDGTYEVFAEIVDTKSWGRRIKKVWVELITDEELEEMEPED